MSESVELVRRAIRRCDLTGLELSRRTGVRAATVSRIQSGKRGLTLHTFDKLAPVLGLKVVDLHEHTPRQPEEPKDEHVGQMERLLGRKLQA